MLIPMANRSLLRNASSGGAGTGLSYLAQPHGYCLQSGTGSALGTTAEERARMMPGDAQ